MQDTCDIAVIGGGFSALAVVANIARQAPEFPAAKPLSIAIFSRDVTDQGVPASFGPAYSTPRDEHLLNVRAGVMGLFADNTGGFLDWARGQKPDLTGDEYLPRRLYARYLAFILDETRALAAAKNIRLRFVRAEVEDIVEAEKNLTLITGATGQPEAARQVVLAIGNSLKARAEDDAQGRLILDPWRYDYAKLNDPARPVKNIALIGAGLTALDAIISILGSGWQGKMTCFSRSAALPLGHLEKYDPSKVPKLDLKDFQGKRLSGILRQLRLSARGAPDWRYGVDALRPLTQSLWKSLVPDDRKRLAGKYFTLWNLHRHRCAAELRTQADAAIAMGTLTMTEARSRGARAVPGGVELELQSPQGSRREVFDLAFSCAGVNYAVANNPLLSRLVASGLLENAGNPLGVRAAEDFSGYKSAAGTLFVMGSSLFGHLFETTAVPELRFQAAKIAEKLIPLLSGLLQSRATEPGAAPGGSAKANATGAP